MVCININNSECQVTGLTLEHIRNLRKILSYRLDPQVRYFSRGPQLIPLIDKTGRFPTGLLYLVEEYLTTKNIKFNTNDIRRVPKALESFPIPSLLHTPYPEQQNAALACLNASRGIVVAPTGVGKSVMAVLIVAAMKVRTLIVVPSLELKRQLTETMADAFGEDQVGDLPSNRTIAVENVDALEPKKILKNYDCVIVDEFHHSGAKTYRDLNKTAWSQVYYKFGLTATPFRSKDEERLLLESVLSKVIYRVTYKEAVEKGYIVPLEAYYVEIPPSRVQGDSWPTVYKELVVDNDIRNRIIASLIMRLHTNRVSTLCLVKEIKHGKAIQDLTKAGFASGVEEDCEQLINWFSSGKLSVLIGTTGVLGEGVDTKPAEYVILAGLGKSRNLLMQVFGRSFRKYKGKQTAKVIIFYDKSHKFSVNHFREQCKVLKEEYGVIPTKLDVDVFNDC